MNSGPIENHMIIVWSPLTVLELIFMYFRQQFVKFFFSEYLWKFLLQWLLHLSLLPFLPWRSVRKYWHQSPEENNSKWLKNVTFVNSFFLFENIYPQTIEHYESQSCGITELSIKEAKDEVKRIGNASLSVGVAAEVEDSPSLGGFSELCQEEV